jgi:hypothetical protein
VPVTASEPFLDGGDWVAVGALVVAIGAAWFARRAAKANEDMVAEQRTANRLHAEELALTQRHRQEDRDAETAATAAAAEAWAAEARAQAARVQVRYSPNAGIDVIVRNNSRRAVHDVRLVKVISTAHPTWTWSRNPGVFGGRREHKPLASQEERVVPVVFTDENGQQQRVAGERYGSLVRFTDEDGTRWEIGDDSGPREVPGDDSDLTVSASD